MAPALTWCPSANEFTHLFKYFGSLFHHGRSHDAFILLEEFDVGAMFIGGPMASINVLFLGLFGLL